MAPPTLPVPAKNCLACGAPLVRKRWENRVLEDRSNFASRKYCNRACMAAAMEGVMRAVPSPMTSRVQSGKAAKGTCEACGKARSKGRLYVHHMDLDPMNNSPLNFMTLCGSCHRRCHSRNFTANGTQRVNCVHCARPSIKRGLCYTHLTRSAKYGDALTTKVRVSSGWVLIRETGGS